MEQRPIRPPDWLDKHWTEWPPEASVVFEILASVAEHRLAQELDQAQAEQRLVRLAAQEARERLG